MVNRALITINLLKNAIGTKHAQAFGGILASHRTLKSLCGLEPDATEADFSGQGLKADDAILIAHSVKVNRALNSLDLCWNNLGEGSETIAQAVLQHPAMEIFCKIPMKKMREDSLTELDLSGQGIGAHGVMVMAPLLEFSRALTSLDISNNEIGAGGAKAIAAALPQS